MDGFTELLKKLIYLGVVCGIAALVAHLLTQAVKRALVNSSIPSASIFVNILRGVVWAFALLAVLQPVFGITPTAFVAALGVTSVVVSFGMQDSISNLMGGLMLLLNHVVSVGDYIKVGEAEGEVTDITWRSTMVKTPGGTVHVIPNSVLNKQALVRLTDWQVSDCSFGVLVAVDALPDEVSRDVAACAQEVLGEHLDERFACDILFTSQDEWGLRAQVHVHVRPTITVAAATDAMLRALADKPWLVRSKQA